MDQFSQILQLIVTGVTNGCVYAIVAIGFSIIYNSTQVINFAQGEFVMVGAMVAAVMMAKFSLMVAFPVAALAGCLVGAIVALCVLASLKRASAGGLIIITVGASIMFRGLAQLFFGEEARQGQPFTGLSGGEDRIFHAFGVAVKAQEIWVVAITALLVLGMHLFFKYTLTGKAMRACSVNPTGAKLVGINVGRMILLSFIMAAGLGAVAGVTISGASYARCTMGTGLGLRGFCAAALGGLGSFGGCVIAGIVLGIVESIAGYRWSDYKDAIAFVILVAILFIRPEGIFSAKKREA